MCETKEKISRTLALFSSFIYRFVYNLSKLDLLVSSLRNYISKLFKVSLHIGEYLNVSFDSDSPSYRGWNCGHREDLRRKKFENGETLRSRLLRGKKKSSPGRFSIPLPRDMEPVRTDEGGWASAGVDEGRETAKADGDGGGRRAALITVLYYKN